MNLLTEPEIIDINPTVIYKNNLNYTISSAQEVFLDNLSISEVNLSKEMNILDMEIFFDLRKEVKQHIDYYQKNICGFLQNNHCLEITESWYRKTPPGNHQDKHNHPNSMLSGVIYLNVPIDSRDHSGINFETTNYIFKNFCFDYEMIPNRYNTKSIFIPVKTKDIILFPSWMNHYVNTNTSNIDSRKIISFNTFMKGKISLGNNFPGKLDF